MDVVLEEYLDAMEKQEFFNMLPGAEEEEQIGKDNQSGTTRSYEIGGGCEDARKPKPASRPYTPSKEEVYEHEVTHLPYRSWCRHCVCSRGVSAPHQSHDKGNKENIGNIISTDYCFILPKEQDEDTPGVLVIWGDTIECL